MRIISGISMHNLNTMAHNRMSLPVDPALLIYSQFEHVYGTAAPQGTQGVAINQLRLLNVLIGQLSQVRRDAAPPPIMAEASEGAVEGLTSPLPDTYIDTLVESYRSEILQTRAASAAMPYISSPSAQSGAVFSLVT